jgi:hypothetical protein
MNCPTVVEMTDERLDRVLTQYRESPKLLHVLRTYLSSISTNHVQICNLPDLFDINSASGDQLTLLGKRLGWPRCHCVCNVNPVFGFDCPEGINVRPVAGFCETLPVSWAECSNGLSEICITDDNLYRSFLRVRLRQFNQQFDLVSLEECLKEFFGDSAFVLYSGQGRVVATPGRDLTNSELLILQLYPRVLPVALGIRLLFHFGETRVFGFGEGWGGLNEERIDVTQSTQAFQRTGKIFGFCGDYGGFCENWETEGLPLLTETGEPILDEFGQTLYSTALTENAAWMCRQGAPWMCEIDVRPYDC